MAQQDAIADSVAAQYAGVMDDLIADCTRLEEKNADLQRQLAVALQVRDAAIAARDLARHERSQHSQYERRSTSPTSPSWAWVHGSSWSWIQYTRSP